MDAVTYPIEEVVDFIHNFMIPLRININEANLLENYQTIWTPTTAVLDLKGVEVQRKIGFFEPNELIGILHLGAAKVHMDAGEHDTAERHLSKLLEECGDTSAVPECVYFRGVNLYKWQDDPSHLKAAYEKLLESYPESCWTKRAAPYRLI